MTNATMMSITIAKAAPLANLLPRNAVTNISTPGMSVVIGAGGQNRETPI